jgi:SAM-dependent methyltransferase
MKLPKKDWYPTKYELHLNHWRGSRATTNFSSYIVEDLQAAAYEAALLEHARGLLIDLGCGNAPLTGVYGPRVDEYIWADWPASSDRQLFQLDHEVDLNEKLALPSKSYDTVLLSDVLEHIAEPDLLMSELARITKPNGHIIVGVPFMYSVHEKPHDYHRYTRFKLSHFASKHGLIEHRIDEVGGALDVWCDLSAKLAHFAWPPLAALPYAFWNAARRVPILKKMNRVSSWKFPLAYIAVFRKPGSALEEG